MSVLPLLLTLLFLNTPEPTVPFSSPINGREPMMRGDVPFPGPEIFNPQASKEILEKDGVEKILFVKRAMFQSSHYYSDFIDGCRFFGTDICVLDLRTGRVASLLPEPMKKGIVNRLDLSFDAKKIVFDWKPDANSGFHLWEMNVDGTDVHQLTFPPADEKAISEKYAIYVEKPWHWVKNPEKYPCDFGTHRFWTDDLHPCYLPDGGIAFVSNRCRYGTLCDGSDILQTTVVYRRNPDGSLEKLTNSSVSESTPTMMEDGRLLYTRWEYVDKGGSCVKCLWSMNPDGTGSAEVYGNDIVMPPAITQGRQVPGEPHLFVATGAPHCPQTAVGTLLRIDTKKNIRTPDAMETLTPETEVLAEGDFKHPLWGENQPPERKWTGPFFLDAYPLSRSRLLMSAMLDKNAYWYRPDGYGLCLFRGTSDYVFLYRAAGISCFDPIPLRARPVPPVRTQPQNENLAEKHLAQCVVTDVYVGLEGVKRGDVKYIRINEQLPRPLAARRNWQDDYKNNTGVDDYDQQHSPAGATHLAVRVQWGIVPVEPDGSASFYVPADRNVFFEVLDENFQELQRERTYVNYRPGETRACIGCHETAGSVPKTSSPQTTLALKREPSTPSPRRCISFVDDVQPVLDKHCISCHDGQHEKNNLDLRGTLTPFFNIAYENLLGFRCSHDKSYPVVERPADQSLVGIVIREIHPKMGNAEYLPARTLGSTTAPLVKLLRVGHYDVTLTPDEMLRITTWIDSNCQYYGSYWGAKNLRFRDLPNFRPRVTFDEAIRTSVPQ